MAQPDWPGTAGFPAIPYRGAWTEKSVQLPFATGNGESASTTPKVLWGTGSPNGVLTGKPGDLAIQTDGATGFVTWQKASGVNTNTGWSLLVSAVAAGEVFVDAYGTTGAGGDDTAVIQAAENARSAGQTLRFTPGKTYLVNVGYTGQQAQRASLLQMKSSGTWDWRGATIKNGSPTTHVNTGADGGALGMINVLASNTLLLGTIDAQSNWRFPIAYLDTSSNHRLDVRISALYEGLYWLGIFDNVSVDVTGVAISARATQVSGTIVRPDCPMISTDGLNTILTHQSVSAFLQGSDLSSGGMTGLAIVMGYAAQNMYVVMPTANGVAENPVVSDGGSNLHHADWIVHDLGHNTREGYGGLFTGASYGYGTNTTICDIIKNGAHSGWHFDNTQSATTTPPNVDITGGTAAQTGVEVYVAGRLKVGNQKPAAGTSFTPDLSKGNDFVFPANGSPTINAPTNAPTNPSGLTLTQTFCVTVQNTTVGAITTTWNAAFHLAGAWADPATMKQRSIWFRYDIAAGVAYEIARSAADVTT